MFYVCFENDMLMYDGQKMSYDFQAGKSYVPCAIRRH